MSRSVLITGCSRGIGAALRDQLLSEGMNVLGVARRAAEGCQHPSYKPIPLDLSELDTLCEALGAVFEEHASLDAVISNAGGPAFGALEQIAPAKIRRQIDLNLVSHLLVVRTAIPYLKRHSRSDLILMGSEASLRGGRRGSIYSAAKFGLRGFAQAMRAECAASGVRVTLIHPGMVRTPFFDGLDFAPGDDRENAIEASDVADTISFVLGSHPDIVFDEITLSPLKKVVRFEKDSGA